MCDLNSMGIELTAMHNTDIGIPIPVHISATLYKMRFLASHYGIGFLSKVLEASVKSVTCRGAKLVAAFMSASELLSESLT